MEVARDPERARRYHRGSCDDDEPRRPIIAPIAKEPTPQEVQWMVRANLQKVHAARVRLVSGHRQPTTPQPREFVKKIVDGLPRG
jgi:hypothetical protein